MSMNLSSKLISEPSFFGSAPPTAIIFKFWLWIWLCSFTNSGSSFGFDLSLIWLWLQHWPFGNSGFGSYKQDLKPYLFVRRREREPNMVHRQIYNINNLYKERRRERESERDRQKEWKWELNGESEWIGFPSP